MTAVAVLACVAAWVPAGLRWLRVSQREHYHPGSAGRFFGRWLATQPVNVLLMIVALFAFGFSAVEPLAAVAGAAAVALVPAGLPVRGRTAPLAWTARMRRLAAVAGVLAVAVLGVGAAAGTPAAGALGAAALMPVLVDWAALLMAPVERRLAGGWVAQATRKLRDLDPTVIAITGSYGKTSTKEYVRHLLAGTHAVVASPASFNNRLGLARTVNEHVTPGITHLVAEMGAYGRGEIAEMCSWVQPRIGVITAIGPVHLERFGSIDEVVAAKSEIVAGVDVAVLNVDHPELAELAGTLTAEVWRCSTVEPAADVHVREEGAGELAVHLRGERLATLAAGNAHASNVACAVAVAAACGVPAPVVAERLADLPGADHRATVVTGASGATIVDDTFNSNPAGARAALELVGRLGGEGGRRVLVTPGMVELGELQDAENEQLAAAAAGIVDDLVIVGRTNRRALQQGAGDRAQVTLVDHREEAVAWVQGRVGAGDVVLYENDLPDHYP